jgi:membrane protease YdiL (CAAX protease family)
MHFFTQIIPTEEPVMDNFMPPREVADICPAPERAAETVNCTRRTKKLSNVICFSLLLQQPIALIGGIILIVLYYFINIVILRNNISMDAIKSLADSSTLAGEIYSSIIYFSYMFIPFILMVFIFKQNPFRIVPVKGIKNKAVILPALALVFGFYFLADLATQYIQVFLGFVNLQATSPDFTPPTGIPAFAVYFFQICIMAPLCEEFIFRGVILHNLKPLGNAFAVLVSALLFSMVHGDLLQMPLAFFVGLLFGVLVIKSGSIWLTVILHASVNTFSVIIDLFGSRLGGNTATLIYLGVVFIAIMACVMVAVYLHVVRKVSFKEKFENFKKSVLPNQFLIKKFVLTPGFLIFSTLTLVYVIIYIKVV